MSEITCPKCHQRIDPADLSQVLHHETGKCLTGEPVEDLGVKGVEVSPEEN